MSLIRGDYISGERLLHWAQVLVPIDHPYIEDRNVAERFVKGELPREEREAFERHYVECGECSDRVALAQIFRVETQTQMARKRLNRPSRVGIFNFLGTFTPREQWFIFAASTLSLLLMPLIALNWFDSGASIPVAAGEPVVWLPAGSGNAVEARVPPGAKWLTLAAGVPGSQGTYRLSIVDVSNRALVAGPDQEASKGIALGLRVPALPEGVSFAVVEKKADNGAYAMVSRHSLLVAWH